MGLNKVFFKHAPEPVVKVLLIALNCNLLDVRVELEKVGVPVSDLPRFVKICIYFDLVVLYKNYN